MFCEQVAELLFPPALERKRRERESQAGVRPVLRRDTELGEVIRRVREENLGSLYGRPQRVWRQPQPGRTCGRPGVHSLGVSCALGVSEVS